MAMTVACYHWRLGHALLRIEAMGLLYPLALVSGAVAGGYGFGTLNLWLSGELAIGRSILGALAGAIFGIEILKSSMGVRQSTGLIVVPAFATSVAIGRIGCFLSGLDDHTYGSPTLLPWGHDFGDGILRHPVQLYESLAMSLFLIAMLVALARRQMFFLRNGFYIMVMYYAGQRFIWEFFKPYATVLGPLNIFHIVSMALVCYAFLMLGKTHECANP
jgi:phosphatidylglycerol---prolipoprotein diacylglyceryl transferase